VSNAQCIALDIGVDLSIEHIDAVLDVVDDWHTAQRLINEAPAAEGSLLADF
jgi:hypothetical protein